MKFQFFFVSTDSLHCGTIFRPQFGFSVKNIICAEIYFSFKQYTLNSIVHIFIIIKLHNGAFDRVRNFYDHAHARDVGPIVVSYWKCVSRNQGSKRLKSLCNFFECIHYLHVYYFKPLISILR